MFNVKSGAVSNIAGLNNSPKTGGTQYSETINSPITPPKPPNILRGLIPLLGTGAGGITSKKIIFLKH